MRTIRTTITALLAPIALNACATGPQVSFDADPSVSFANYRTYGWSYTAAPAGVNPLTINRIRDSIDRYLTGRGYSQGGSADFTVAFTVGARNRVEVTDFGGYGGFYRPYWGGWGAYGPRDIDVRNVTDGTLVIDIYDAKTKQPIWHGTATQQVGSKSVTQEQIDQAVAAVLANFPPPAK